LGSVDAAPITQKTQDSRQYDTIQYKTLNPFPFLSPSRSIHDQDIRNLENSKEEVLHSIFSPSIQSHEYDCDDENYFEHEEQMWNELCDQQQHVTPNRLPVITEEDSIISPPSAIHRCSSQKSVSSSPFWSLADEEQSEKKSCISNEDDKHTHISSTFFTPSSRLTDYSKSLKSRKKQSSRSQMKLQQSQLSFASPAILCTDHNLPMELLNFEFVKNAQSKADLQKIIIALETSSPDSKEPCKFPSLLRLAKERIQTLSNCSIPKEISYDLCPDNPHVNSSHEENRGDNQSVNKKNSPHRVAWSAPTSPLSKKNGKDIGNISSGSPMCQSVVDFSSSSTPYNNQREPEKLDDQSISTNTSQITSTFLPEDEFLECDMRLQRAISDLNMRNKGGEIDTEMIAVSDARNSISSAVKQILSERDDMEQDLSSQVLVLSSQLEEVVSSFETEKRSLLSKIQGFEMSKEEMESDLKGLEHTLADMNINKIVLKNALQERDTLQRRLEGLNRHIVIEQKKMQHVKNDMELAIRKKFETRIQHLSNNVNDLSNERSLLQTKIQRQEKLYLDMTHKFNKEIISKQKVEQENKIMQTKCNEYQRKITLVQEGADILRRKLSHSESRFQKELQIRKRIEEEYSKLAKGHSDLKEKFFILSEKFKESEEEKKSARGAVNEVKSKLDSNSNHIQHTDLEIEELRKERDYIEEKYQAQMKQLRKQLSTKGSMVSVELYRKAVHSARELQEQLNEKNTVIRGLKGKVEELCKKSGNKKPLLFSPSRQKSPKFTNKSSIKSLGKSSGKIVSRKLHSISPSPTNTKQDVDRSPSSSNFNIKSSSRISTVRAAGGRAGLKAKLKKARGIQVRNESHYLNKVNVQKNLKSQDDTSGSKGIRVRFSDVFGKENVGPVQ